MPRLLLRRVALEAVKVTFVPVIPNQLNEEKRMSPGRGPLHEDGSYREMESRSISGLSIVAWACGRWFGSDRCCAQVFRGS